MNGARDAVAVDRPHEPAADRSSAIRSCSVIVVTYNSASTLGTCLDALLPQVADVGGEVAVLDNGSTDATLQVAESRGVTPIRTGANLGFGRACNLGAARTNGELVVLLNPDAILDEGALAALLAAARTAPRPGPLGGRARHDDGSYDRRSALGRPRLRGALTFALGINRLRRGSAFLDPEHGPVQLPRGSASVAVDAVSGALLAVPRPLWQQLGGFDERFFLYGEDVDLCLRAAAGGAASSVVTAAGYRHVGGVSSAGTGLGGVLLYRGKVELYRRHLSPAAARIAVSALVVGTLLRGLPAVVGRGRLAAKAGPWWTLFGSRRAWRMGYPDGGHEGAAS